MYMYMCVSMHMRMCIHNHILVYRIHICIHIIFYIHIICTSWSTFNSTKDREHRQNTSRSAARPGPQPESPLCRSAGTSSFQTAEDKSYVYKPVSKLLVRELDGDYMGL